MTHSDSSKKDLISSRFIGIGQFGKSHALGGEVRLYCEPALSQLLQVGALMYVRQKNDTLPVRVLSVRQQPGSPTAGLDRELFFVKLDRIQSREEADRLRDHELYVLDSPEITTLIEEAKHSTSTDYTGFVVTNQQQPFGVVERVIETPAHLVLVIRVENQEVLVPFSEPFIHKENTTDRVLYGRDLEQFLEI